MVAGSTPTGGPNDAKVLFGSMATFIDISTSAAITVNADGDFDMVSGGMPASQGLLTTAILWDISLENSINMVVSHNMVLAVRSLLHNFRVPAKKDDGLGAIRDQYQSRFV